MWSARSKKNEGYIRYSNRAQNLENTENTCHKHVGGQGGRRRRDAFTRNCSCLVNRPIIIQGRLIAGSDSDKMNVRINNIGVC